MMLSMDILTDPVFWSDVGLAVAARLAMAAMLLWIMKVMFERHLAVRVQIESPRFVGAVPKPAEPSDESATRITMHRAPERKSPAGTVASNDNPADRRRDELRDRLLKYVEQRQTERRPR